MSKPAADALQRIRANHPSATVVERHQSSITADVGGGRKALVSTIGAMHYDDNGWQEIDTTWQASAGAWQYEMTTAPYQASARDTFNAGEVVEYRTRAGEWVRFQPLSLNWRDSNGSTQQIAVPQAVATVASDDVLSWPNGYGAGRDFSWTAHPTRLQKLLTVQSAANLPTPTVSGGGVELELTFAFTFDASVTAFVDGTAWDRSTTRTTGNAIEFRNAVNDVLWAFEAPRAWDSAGNETTGSMSFYRTGNTRHVAVRIPRAFVDAAVFPLFVDPTVNVFAAGNDHDINFRLSSGATSSASTLLHGDAFSGSIYVHFAAVGVPQGATITEATLSFFGTGGTEVAGDILSDVRAEDTDNGNVITSGVTLITAARTSASVAWDLTSGTTGGALYSAPDIATVIQELVDRIGWVSGNNINILVDVDDLDANVTGYSRYAAYENATYDPASLYVAYTTGGGGTPVTLTPDGFVSASGVEDQAAGTTDLHLAIDDSPDTSDGDTTYLVNSASASGEAILTLSDTPGDFESMTTLRVRVRLRRE